MDIPPQRCGSTPEPAPVDLSVFQRSLGLPGGRRLLLTWARSAIAFGRIEDMFFVKPLADFTRVYEEGHRRATQIALGRLSFTLERPPREDVQAGPPKPAPEKPDPATVPPSTRLRSILLANRRLSLLQAQRPFGYPHADMTVVVRFELSAMLLSHGPLQARPLAHRLIVGRHSFWIHPEHSARTTPDTEPDHTPNSHQPFHRTDTPQ